MCAGRHSDLPVVHERGESPGRSPSGAFFYCAVDKRFVLTGLKRNKKNDRQHSFTHSYAEIRRLSDDSRELLARCGIKINLHTQRLIAMAENMPIDILRVRDDDIPGLVMDGVVDLGIIGENVLEEELLNRRAWVKIPLLYPASSGFRRLPLSLATLVDEARTARSP